MTAWRARDRQGYKVRVRSATGVRVCGCDTRSATVADAMGRWARSLHKGSDRRMDVLDAIVAGRVTLAEAYDSRRDLDALMARANDIDLEPLVARWAAWKEGARKGAGSADRYRRQVEALIAPGKAFRRSDFTDRAIRKHLAALEVDDATRNRHKAAFSSFGRWLVDHDHLERNVVRDIPGWPVAPGRLVWYEMADAKRVIEALPQPFRALEALMLATCMEWQAIERLTVADVKLKAGTAEAKGTKTGQRSWRTRTVKLLEIFDWCVPHIRPALKGKLPHARVFDGITNRAALAAHHEAVAACKLPDSRLHDWRHTHVIHALRAGYPPVPLARQAGHRDAHLLWTTYGRHIPKLDELRPTTTLVAAKEGTNG